MVAKLHFQPFALYIALCVLNKLCLRCAACANYTLHKVEIPLRVCLCMCVDITLLAGGPTDRPTDLPTPNDRDDIAVRLFLRLLCAKTSTATHSTTTQLRFLEPFGLLILLQLICPAAPASGY
jgi:hypothetical protein